MAKRIKSEIDGKQDMKNVPCDSCKQGKFVETSIYDDWTGTLHCSSCGRAVARWQGK